MSGTFTVTLRAVVTDPLPMKQHAREILQQLFAARCILSEMLKQPLCPANELTFEMVYDSQEDFLFDRKYQFFNEARAHVRALRLVENNNRIILIKIT